MCACDVDDDDDDDVQTVRHVVQSSLNSSERVLISVCIFCTVGGSGDVAAVFVLVLV